MILLLESLRGNQFQYDCGMALELEPLKYIIVTRSVELKIRLNSNCMSLRDFQLETDFSFKNRFS